MHQIQYFLSHEGPNNNFVCQGLWEGVKLSEAFCVLEKF